MQCPNCGDFIEDHVTVCTSCSAELAVRKICPQCKHQEESTAVYCGECGYLLKKEVICIKEGKKKTEEKKETEVVTNEEKKINKKIEKKKEKIEKKKEKIEKKKEKIEKKKEKIEKKAEKAIAREEKKAVKRYEKAKRKLLKKEAREKTSSTGKRRGLKIFLMLVLVAVVLIAGGIWYESMYGYELVDTYMAEENRVSQEKGSNVLMSQELIFEEGKVSYHQMSKEAVFDSSGARMDIGSVTFFDSLEELHGNYWDASETGDGSVMAWVDYNGSTGYYDLFIGAEGGVIAPENCAGLFCGYINTEYIRFNGAFDISHVSDISYMFYGCENLKEVDLGGLDTSNVTNMCSLFSECQSIEELDVSGFDTSRVTDMRWMFDDCHSLTTVNVGNFDTSQVTNMRGMFAICRSLQQLDVTNFNTSCVTDMAAMFSGCESLKELDISSFDTSRVTSMEKMFMYAPDGFVLHYNPDSFDTSRVTEHDYFMPDSFDWKKMFD